ncbi:DUF2911 domain-containing protein [Tellurirhabdus bombi]|uniref:DUF2911 domain-containing protein n=1 Tax=Tellurirhabdus bombi TaxID=2907205 RepID=UPI001F26B3E3|nr:DUF2911 domain-containing protein [Tellurirhabdus bombi]
MKQVLSLIAFLIFLTSSFAFAQKTSPLSPKITSESPNKVIKVIYGQPSKRKRQIFGAMVPYGEVWRTGANNATQITFTKDVVFGDKAVPAGTYTLFTIPMEKEWTVILNGKLDQWGAFDYDRYKNKNVAQVKVPVVLSKLPLEKLTITPGNNVLAIAWDKVSISVPIR